MATFQERLSGSCSLLHNSVCVHNTCTRQCVSTQHAVDAQSYDGSVVKQVRVQESSRQAPVVVFSRRVTVPGIASSPAGAGVFSVHVVTPADDD